MRSIPCKRCDKELCRRRHRGFCCFYYHCHCGCWCCRLCVSRTHGLMWKFTVLPRHTKATNNCTPSMTACPTFSSWKCTGESGFVFARFGLLTQCSVCCYFFRDLVPTFTFLLAHPLGVKLPLAHALSVIFHLLVSFVPFRFHLPAHVALRLHLLIASVLRYNFSHFSALFKRNRRHLKPFSNSPFPAQCQRQKTVEVKISLLQAF